MIKIDLKYGAAVGDFLSSVPWMDYLCQQHGTEAVVVGASNRFVVDLLGASYPFIFDDDDPDSPTANIRKLIVYDAIYEVSVGVLWGFADKVHMCQCFFAAAGKPLPKLPLTLDLRCEPSGLPSGVVLSPYSRSDCNHNKLWPHERWLSVINSLRQGGQIDRVYVVGVSDCDDPAPYVAEGVEPFFDRPLSQVLSLMRQAPLVLTIDNGISHLAHYGSVGTHVLLYPGCLAECWVPNPYAVIVRAPNPIDIQPYAILQAARTVLGRPRHVPCGL